MASIHGSTYFVTGDWSVPRVRSELPLAYVRICVRRDSGVWGGRFKHAKKIVVEEPPESMDALRELLSKEVCVRCLLYTSPSPRDATLSRMPSSA